MRDARQRRIFFILDAMLILCIVILFGLGTVSSPGIQKWMPRSWRSLLMLAMLDTNTFLCSLIIIFRLDIYASRREGQLEFQRSGHRPLVFSHTPPTWTSTDPLYRLVRSHLHHMAKLSNAPHRSRSRVSSAYLASRSLRPAHCFFLCRSFKR